MGVEGSGIAVDMRMIPTRASQNTCCFMLMAKHRSSLAKQMVELDGLRSSFSSPYFVVDGLILNSRKRLGSSSTSLCQGRLSDYDFNIRYISTKSVPSWCILPASLPGSSS